MRERAKALLLLPAVVWCLLLTAGPTGYVVFAAFRAPRFDAESRAARDQWVGGDNFVRIARSDEIRRSIAVTLTIAVLAVGIETSLGFGFALAARRWLARRQRWIRTALASPMFLAPVAVGYLATTVFAQEAGLVNRTIRLIAGVAADQLPAWRSDWFWAISSIVIVDVWQWTPFCFVLLLSALESGPVEVYEAAALDGATGWSGFWHVTLPLTRPTLALVVLLRVVELLKLYDVPYGLTRGGPGTWTRSYAMWIKESALTFQDAGLASALGLAMLGMLGLLATALLPLLRRLQRAADGGKASQ